MNSPANNAVNVGRWTANVDGDFVVFVIGAHIEHDQDLAEALEDYSGGMLPMLEYLTQHPEFGLLGYHAPSPLLTVQYWRSFEHLEAFARNDTAPHFAAWRKYQQRASGKGRSGIFHETFLVKAGQYESVYDNMRPTGLGAFATLTPLAGSNARSRIGTVG